LYYDLVCLFFFSLKRYRNCVGGGAERTLGEAAGRVQGRLGARQRRVEPG